MQIEPCPFCGGEASVVQFVGDLYVVKCDYCFVRTSKYSEKEKAISAWNRRKAPEIIFCKDCADWGTEDCAMVQEPEYWTNPDGHCHFAERRTDK